MKLPSRYVPTLRAYATKSRPKSHFGKGVSLDHFLQRSRALSLWRDIVRATRRIEDVHTRREMRDTARAEFERNRGVTDIIQIRYLISTGKTQWANTERYIDGM